MGAATSGITAACLLQRKGHHVSLFDRVPHPQVDKCGVMLRGNAIDELFSAGLGQAAQEIIDASIPLSKFFFNDLRGKLREATDPSPYKTDRLSRFVRRNDIVHALYNCFEQSAKGSTSHSAFYGGKELKSVHHGDTQVTAVFADGSSWTGDLLVGCDGVRSVTAQYVAPERQLVFLNRQVWRGMAPDGTFANNGHCIIFGPEADLYASSYDVGHDQRGQPWSHWAVFRTVQDSDNPQGVRTPHGHVPEEILQRLSQDFVRVVSKTPASEIIHSLDYSVKPLSTYVRGRVVLVGDAAHAMSSSLAWGMASGIADAVYLSNVITTGDCLLQSLETYDKERRPITQRHQRASRGVNKASLKK